MQDYLFSQKQRIQQRRQKITPLEEQIDLDSNQSNIDSENDNDQSQLIIHGNVLTQSILNPIQLNQSQIIQHPSQQTQLLQLPQQPQEKKEYKANKFIKLEHNIDHNYLILLIILNKRKIIEIQKICKNKTGKIQFIPKLNKLIIEAATKQQAQSSTEAISNYLDKLSVYKLPIKGQPARIISSFQMLKQTFANQRIVIFGVNGPYDTELMMGGEMKPSILRQHSQIIMQIKAYKFFMKDLRNKRSYRIIISQILKTEHMIKSFKQFGQVIYATVDMNFSEKMLKIYVGSTSKKEISPSQFTNFLKQQIEKYYVLTWICNKSQYIQKPKCQKITFIKVPERKKQIVYWIVLGLREDFIAKKEQIFNEINKFKNITGIRFFEGIYPLFTSFKLKIQDYFFYRFPKTRHYSTVVYARKTKQQTKIFDWKAIYQDFIEVGRKYLQ